MPKSEKWKDELNEYICQKEPGKAERSKAWKTAIGLQEVDGLKPSNYLLDVAKKHIEGDINISDAKDLITSYYKTRNKLNEEELSTKEADSVSARITELLQEQSFTFSPVQLQTIHKKLFEEVLSHPGKFRDYNISKNEWVLKGKSVVYVSYDDIKETLEYDFDKEKGFSYENVSLEEAIKHLASFTSDIWQVHPFEEGNTRTTAIFIIKYLRTFGFQIDNNMFEDNSWYFRNALVRANYSDLQKGIYKTTKYLEMFFENLLLRAEHELKNRNLHITNAKNAAGEKISYHRYSFEEMGILDAIKSNPKITQKELAEIIGKSERSVKRLMDKLKKDDMIVRENGKKTGVWKLTDNYFKYR